MPVRAKPYFLKSPITPEKIEQIDEMFRILFDDLRNGNLSIGPGQINVAGFDDGDILYINGSGLLDGLSVGANNTVLKSNGSLPQWGLVDLDANTVGTLPISKGGTGATSKTTAFDNLSPLTTLGDLLTHNGSDNIRLGVGANDEVLTIVAGVPEWAALPTGHPAVTLAGSFDYLTIDVPTQVITLGAIDLTADVTLRLPYANLTAATAASRLFGRGSAAGSGDWQEITLGANLTMTGTVLDAVGGGGGSGDVVGPSSSLDGEIVLFDGTTGKLIKAATGSGFVKATSGVYSTQALIDLATDVTGTLPPSSIEHNFLSATHPDTIPATPVYGDVVVAGAPTGAAVLQAMVSRSVESFRGVRPAYLGGIPGNTATPTSGPFPQMLASRIRTVAPSNLPLPFPYHVPLSSRLIDDFIGVRPSYIPTLPAVSGPFPSMAGFPVTYDAFVPEEASTLSSQWQRAPIGPNGSVWSVVDGFPTWSAPVGDVLGPLSSVDNTVARFNTTTGKLIQDSLVTISDAGGLFAPSLGPTLPTYGFSSDPDTGLGHWSAVPNTLLLIAGGSIAVLADATSFTLNAGVSLLGAPSSDIGLQSQPWRDLFISDDVNIIGSAGSVTWQNTSGTANSRRFTATVNSATFNLNATNDAESIVNVGLQLTNSAGTVSAVTLGATTSPLTGASFDLGLTGTRWRDLYASRNIFEQARTTALGDFTDVAFSASDFTSDVGTWVVGAGDIVVWRYSLLGPDLAIVQLEVAGTTLTGTPAVLSVRLPSGWSFNGAVDILIPCRESGTELANAVRARTRNASRFIDLTFVSNGVTFPNSTDAFDLSFSFPVSVST